MVCTLVALILQNEHQLGGLQMPLANQRAPNGHLFCQEVADVPEKTVLPLKFPVHLGSLSLPVSVRLVIVATVKLLSCMMQCSPRPSIHECPNDGTSQTFVVKYWCTQFDKKPCYLPCFLLRCQHICTSAVCPCNGMVVGSEDHRCVCKGGVQLQVCRGT